MGSPATPGFFFCFAAFVLLLVVTVSVPIWDDVYFASATINGNNIRYGTFGYTGSSRQVGYDIIPSQLGYDNTDLNKHVFRNLTFVLVLHPIAAAFALISVIFGLCGTAYSRIGTILMALSAYLATLVALIVMIIDLVLWGIVRNHVRNDGFEANYGNATWLVVAAFVSLLIGACAGTCGSFGRFRQTRYNNTATTAAPVAGTTAAAVPARRGFFGRRTAAPMATTNATTVPARGGFFSRFGRRRQYDNTYAANRV